MSTLLEVKDITKIYPNQPKPGLDHVSFEVMQGEFLGIMGASGSGKTTLLNVLSTIDIPTSGSIRMGGKKIQELSQTQAADFRKNNLGFIFQSFNLIDELTVCENVELPLIYIGVKANERKERVKKVLEKVNLLHRANHYPQQLSGGQQQRVAIARAVVTDCKLLLADEPTGNLDSVNGIEVMELLSELNAQGTTIIIVTHSQRDAMYAHRVIQLLDGQIVAENVNRPLGKNMSAKNCDTHNRFRDKTIAFRVSSEEDKQINTVVELSGMTKQDYITSKLLDRTIYVKGNCKVHRAVYDKLNEVLAELQRIENGGTVDDELMANVKLIAGIIDNLYIKSAI